MSAPEQIVPVARLLDEGAPVPAAPSRSRDRELVRYVGRHGVVTVRHVEAAMEVRRAATYRRARRCIEAGLLERRALLPGGPSVLLATREGLRYAGLGGLPVAGVSLGTVDHSLRCASVAQRLVEAYGARSVLTERDIAHLESIEARPVASVGVGHDQRGAPRRHRADLAILTGEGVTAVEVELTAKAPRRLVSLIGAWRAARIRGELAGVHYLCEPGQTRRAVERAVEAAGAGDSVAVGEVPS